MTGGHRCIHEVQKRRVLIRRRVHENRGYFMVFRFLLAMVVTLGLVAPAHAKRIALVIGNAEYTELADLQKTLGDAGGYRDALSGLGFEVTYRTDLDFFGTADAVGNFVDRIQAGDEVAFVFAGHGWSDGQTNFLLPTDSPRSAGEATLKHISLTLKNGASGILDQINAKGAKLTFAIIDACRENPFIQPDGTRSAGLARGGLSKLISNPGENASFVVFSAGANQLALDRLSNSDPNPYSVFTRVFLPKLRAGGSLEVAADEAKFEVSREAASIGHFQTPDYFDHTSGQTFLRTSATNLSRIAVTPNPAPVAQTQTTVPAVNAAEKAYNVAKAFGTSGAFQAVINSYPGTFWAQIAAEEIAKLTPSPVPTPAPQIAAVPSDPCRDFAGTPPLNAECVVENGRAVWLSKGLTPAELERQRQEAARLQADRQAASAAPSAIVSRPNGGQTTKEEDDCIAGDASQCFSLGVSLITGRYGDQKDYRRAAAAFLDACDGGVAMGCTNLAALYGRGQGVTRDHERALMLYRQACEGGNAQGCSGLGNYYRLGLGVSKDLTLARQLLTQGCNGGQQWSCDRLGEME